jgi:hypothetical protein
MIKVRSARHYADLAVRYPIYLGRVRLAFEAGFGIIVMRGPYTIVEAGMQEDRRFAEFMHPRIGMSVRF